MIDLNKLFITELERAAESAKAAVSSIGKSYFFHQQHLSFYEFITARLGQDDNLELNFYIPQHYELHLNEPSPQWIKAIISRFELEFGPTEKDEITEYGAGYHRTLKAPKLPAQSYWAPKLALYVISNTCKLIFDEVEEPAQPARIVKKVVGVDCGESKEPLPEQPPTDLSPPSGDEDQPRRESDEVPF